MLAATAEVGIPLAARGSYIRNFLKGEANTRVASELAAVSRPTMEDVLEVLRKFFGSPHTIMRQIIKSHKVVRTIPSCTNSSWDEVHHIASNHRKLIISAKELGDSTDREDTIYSWSYQDALEAALPQSE